MSDRNLILIPSPLVLPYSYHFLRPELASKFRLFLPTIPEIAFHFTRKFFWTADDYAEWLFEYMQKKGIKKSFILGHSNSGSIAIRFAELHPDEVEGIIITDTIGVEKRSVAKILWGRVVDAFIEWKLTLWGFHHLIWNLILHPTSFIYQIWLSKSEDIKSSAKKLKVPVLILWGRRDHTIPLSMGDELKRLVPNAEMYVSKEGSHDWILTHHKEAVSVIDKWTAKISRVRENSQSHLSLHPASSH